MSSQQKRDTLSNDEKKSLNDKKIEEDIEHPSDVIGGWGPTQKRVVFYLILIYCVAPFSNSHIIYTAPSKVGITMAVGTYFFETFLNFGILYSKHEYLLKQRNLN